MNGCLDLLCYLRFAVQTVREYVCRVAVQQLQSLHDCMHAARLVVPAAVAAAISSQLYKSMAVIYCRRAVLLAPRVITEVST